MAQGQLNSCRLLVIGGSAGSLEVLLQVLPYLRADMPFPIVLVMHRRSAAESTLEELLASRTTLQVREAGDKDRLRPGFLYVAPGDYHLLVERNGRLSLDVSEKMHYCRPAIDATFDTAADAFGSSLACILLSGANADGADGLRKAHALGARVFVQDPATADVTAMPEAGLAAVPGATVLLPQSMAALINDLG
ncbi:MAG: chemotaxis protein CheB [Flaviaesturariibacter sp.]|nr:chemotaxis protein CheB [Flaviaesturariibacter sp.]